MFSNISNIQIIDRTPNSKLSNNPETPEYINMYIDVLKKETNRRQTLDMLYTQGTIGIAGNVANNSLNAGLIYMHNFKLGFNNYTNTALVSTGLNRLCINNVCSQHNGIILCNVIYEQNTVSFINFTDLNKQKNITAKYTINDIVTDNDKDKNDLFDVLKNNSISKISSIINGAIELDNKTIIKSYNIYFNIALKNPNKVINSSDILIVIIVDGYADISYSTNDFLDPIPKTYYRTPVKHGKYMLYNYYLNNMSNDSIIKFKISYYPAIDHKPYFIIKGLKNAINNLGKLV